jgi:uncharacterized protein (DUF1330 family)
MSKGYWVGAYRSISDPTALASYAKLAGPAIEAAGGRFLARGGTVKTHEAGVNERTVIVEFASFELALCLLRMNRVGVRQAQTSQPSPAHVNAARDTSSRRGPARVRRST